MDLVLAAQYIELTAGVLLLAKLFWSGLHKKYAVFCLFLAADLCGSALWLVSRSGTYFDYNVVWLVDRIVVWSLMVWTVVVLLNAILENYPGILRISRNVLKIILVSVFAIGVLSAVPEYARAAPFHDGDWVNRSLAAGYVIERVVSSASLVCLLLMLVFLLWFPVEIPRNLGSFCAGFVVYFAVATGVLLFNNYTSAKFLRFVNVTASSVESACLAYWFVALSRAGEIAQSTLSLRWRRGESDRIIAQLESINQSLIRSTRR